MLADPADPTPPPRVARLLAVGHGGQTLLSRATAELIREELPPQAALRDLGTHHLKDLTHPEHIFQLVTADLPANFPPLRTLDVHLTNLPAQPTPLIGRAEVLDSLEPAQHLFTYTGHPPSAAAAVQVLSIIEENNIVANAGQVGKRLINKIENVQRQFPGVIVEARGRGLMIGAEINISKNPLACKLFATRCVEKGVYVGYFGDAQQVVRIEPPLILTENQADVVTEVISEVAEEMHAGRIPSATKDKVNRFAIGL